MLLVLLNSPHRVCKPYLNDAKAYTDAVAAHTEDAVVRMEVVKAYIAPVTAQVAPSTINTEVALSYIETETSHTKDATIYT